jgi:hypothetical protein
MQRMKNQQFRRTTIGAPDPWLIEAAASIGLAACCTCRFFSLHPAGSGQKTFDKWAALAVCRVKNRLIGDFFGF